MAKKETVEDLLFAIDQAISDRDKGLQIIDDDYVCSDGKIISAKYQEYKQRKEEVNARFTKKYLELLKFLDTSCIKIRSKQPDLRNLTCENLKYEKKFPRKLVLGRNNIKYENLDIFVPRSIELPIKKAMYSTDLSGDKLIQCLLLRLLYALPLNKVEFTIYDPNKLGGSVENFRKLFDFESVISAKKVITTQKELKQVLLTALDYCEKLIQKTFSIECNNWSEFNRVKYSQGVEKQKQMLPYKVFILFNMPSGMDSECLEMFQKLIKNGPKLGILVLFSFDKDDLSKANYYAKSLTEKLQSVINDHSFPITKVVENLSKPLILKNLSIQEFPEKLPSENVMNILIDGFIQKTRDLQTYAISFESLLDSNQLFNLSSIKSISIPLGFDSSGDKVVLELGDDPPHALIGGTTGSGKSNLIHNLILSACHRYDPSELNLYLMDFKEGVELSVYAKCKLPHAKLVANEADIEFGVSVLSHLVSEIKKRYSQFKRVGVNNFFEYRNTTQENMPRLLLIVDEFQVLLNSTLKHKVQELFAMIVKQGRACGVHIVMATQTLNGLDFSALGTQFGGRIALKCSEDDSKKILGGLSNDVAASIGIPYAILNTKSGIVSYNVKFGIPYAEPSKVKEAIKELDRSCLNKKYIVERKVFEGMQLPMHPEDEMFYSENAQLVLGEELTYESSLLKIYMKEKSYFNLMICGNDQQITDGIFESVCKSAKYSKKITNAIYIGSRNTIDSTNFGELKKYKDIGKFLRDFKENIPKERNLIILDNVNAIKEINFPQTIYPGMTMTEEQEQFKELLDNCNSWGTYLIAFYDKVNQCKASGITIDKFDLRIGYQISDVDMNTLIGQPVVNFGKITKTNRAFYAVNGEIISWFKPFVGDDYE